MTDSPQVQAHQQPLHSEAIEDSDTFGVVSVVSPEEAERLGAFREDALSPVDAWESQADVGAIGDVIAPVRSGGDDGSPSAVLTDGEGEANG